MLRLRFRFVPSAVSAAVATAMLVTPAISVAQSRYDRQAYPPVRHQPYRTPLEVWLSGEGWDEDYSSSHACVGGYRWMTRNVDQGNSSAAQASVPVRC